MQPCPITLYFLPQDIPADLAGEVSIAARKEAKSCRTRHDKLIECVMQHNGDVKK